MVGSSPDFFCLCACAGSSASSLTSLPEEISDSTITLPNDGAKDYLARFNTALTAAVAKDSNDAAASVNAFAEAQAIMAELQAYKEKVEAGEVECIASESQGKTGKLLNEEYWHLQYKLLHAFKYQLAVSNAKDAYVRALGQEKFDRLLARDPNQVFTKRTLEMPTLTSLQALLDEAVSLSSDSKNAQKGSIEISGICR